MTISILFRRAGGLAALGAGLFILGGAAPAPAQTPEMAAPQSVRVAELEAVVAALADPAILAPAPAVSPTSGRYLATGEASYYGNELAGNRTANGERFNPQALTAAHRSLPMGTRLRVTNVANGKSVVVRINDRGPFARGRILDVSLAAARQIAMIRSGTARVRLEILRT